MPDGATIPFIGHVSPPGSCAAFAWRETLCQELGATILHHMPAQRFHCRLRLGNLDYKEHFLELTPDVPAPIKRLMDIKFNMVRMKTVLESVMAGRMQVVDSLVVEDFVLRKGGSSVFLVPYEGTL